MPFASLLKSLVSQRIWALFLLVEAGSGLAFRLGYASPLSVNAHTFLGAGAFLFLASLIVQRIRNGHRHFELGLSLSMVFISGILVAIPDTKVAITHDAHAVAALFVVLAHLMPRRFAFGIALPLLIILQLT